MRIAGVFGEKIIYIWEWNQKMKDTRPELKIIAHIHTDFPEKFGIPRQSGLVKELRGTIVFEPEYRNPEALRGLEGFDYLWVLWEFEGTEREHWKASVRPPRLGGNKKMGVFATRSPFRPNPIGLSSVKLDSIEQTEKGMVLRVSGVDMKDGTPIYDIKPYLPYADSHPDAKGGFAHEVRGDALEVEFPEELLKKIPLGKQKALIELLKQDPRPHYQHDSNRVYGIAFDRFNVSFKVDENVLAVIEVAER